MLIEAKKLIGLPIAAEDTQSRVGEIKQLIIDPENGRLLGFAVSHGIFSPSRVLSVTDVRIWDPIGLVTGSIENLVPAAEIIRIKAVLDQNIDFIGLKAKTESGKSLGYLEDLLIDTDTEAVTKYYLRDLFGKTKILPAEKVVKIEKQTIIFLDDTNEAPIEGATALV